MQFAELVRLPSLSKKIVNWEAAMWAYLQNTKFFYTGNMDAELNRQVIIKCRDYKKA